MPEKIYSFNGKDITMNVCIQIRCVVKLLQEQRFLDNISENSISDVVRKNV